MSNAKNPTMKNTAKSYCGGACDCETCSCGCQGNACRCQATNCQCGCQKPATNR